MSGFPDLSDTRRGQVRPVRAGPQAARAGAAAAWPLVAAILSSEPGKPSGEREDRV